jgi:hypothetical protein
MLDLCRHAVRQLGGAVRKRNLRQIHEPGAVAGVQCVVGGKGRVGADPAHGAVKDLVESIDMHLEAITLVDPDPIGFGYIDPRVGCLAGQQDRHRAADGHALTEVPGQTVLVRFDALYRGDTSRAIANAWSTTRSSGSPSAKATKSPILPRP